MRTIIPICTGTRMTRFTGEHRYIWDTVGGILHSMHVGAILFIGLGTILTIIPIGTDHINIIIIGLVAITIMMFAIITLMTETPIFIEACPRERITYKETTVAFQEPAMWKAINWQEV